MMPTHTHPIEEDKMDRLKSVLLTLALLLIAAGAAPAQQIEVREVDGAVAAHNVEPGSAPAFWTPERLRAAQPMKLPGLAGGPQPAQRLAPQGPPRAEAGTVPAAETLSEERAEMMRLAAEALAAGEEAGGFDLAPRINGGALWYAYPPPFTRYFLQYAKNSYPHSTLGKLFFTDNFGNGYSCSGAAVVSGNQAIYATAGHCCATGNPSLPTWYTNWLFVPGCAGSPGCAVAPFGVWDWECAVVRTEWFSSGDLARDVCFLSAAPNGGNELHQVVGSLGIAWNQPLPLHHHTTGWPAAAPFDGSRLVFSVASTADRDGAFTPNTLGLGSDLTPGSSGGAWIWRYKQGASATNQYWNGVNSYKYIVPPRPLEMYGPYVDTVIRDLKNVCDF
jgi:hypothetical protein